MRRPLQPLSTRRAPVYPAFPPPSNPRAAIRQHTEEVIGGKDLCRLLYLLTKDRVAVLRRSKMRHRIHAAASERHAKDGNAVRPNGSAGLSATEDGLVIDLVAPAQGVVDKYGSFPGRIMGGKHIERLASFAPQRGSQGAEVDQRDGVACQMSDPPRELVLTCRAALSD